MRSGGGPRRRWLVPEVVQTSAMDCGPAVLKGLLEGFGIPVHYGRLREACQTDVDGTSIDVLEAVAGRLGLEAEQVMVPADHLLLPEAGALPAILVVRLPNGFTHFVLAWRRHGPLVQVMDPAEGRRWLTCQQLLDEVYIHTLAYPADAWRDWAASDEFVRPLARRLRSLCFGHDAAALLDTAVADPGWRPLATLDAATRLVESLVRAGGVRRGREAKGLVRSLLAKAEAGATGAVPEPFWAVLPAPSGPEDEEMVRVRGAVLVHVRGRTAGRRAEAADAMPLGPELAAALAEPRSRPVRQLFHLLRGAGLSSSLLLGLVLTAGGTVFEGLLLRGVLDIGRDLSLVAQRFLAVVTFLAFATLLLLAELGVVRGLLRLGRQLEVRFRAAFGAKVPRLNDRYFQSRPISDMAERCHKIQHLRLLPPLAGQALRSALTLGATAAAIAWTEPSVAALAAAAAALMIVVPFAFNPLLQGLDLRVRTHEGALGRFYLDALLGLAAIRAHGAGRAVRREHEGLLVDWARASRRLLRWAMIAEGVQAAVGFGLAGWLILLDAGRVVDAGGILLLAYWALNMPLLGEEIALLARQYPLHRSTTLRLLEPLGAPEEDDGEADERGDVAPVRLPEPTGVAITFESVAVRAAGHSILQDVELRVPAGSQVAIVGPSGAGKSTLVGLLLGWHRPASGRVLVEGEPLDAARLGRLREQTAWVDPAVQLWNRSLLENLRYGTWPDEVPEMGEVLRGVGLFDVLRHLPEGLQTPLGEGGGLLSGGEGQLVRLGRAWSRSRPRLVILDEPFRGLDRERRRLLLCRARQHFQGATLLCVTHDVGATVDFDRVLVVEAGWVVEDGSPQCLAADPDSRYRALLDAEAAVRAGLWAGPAWERLWIEAGRVIHEGEDHR